MPGAQPAVQRGRQAHQESPGPVAGAFTRPYFAQRIENGASRGVGGVALLPL